MVDRSATAASSVALKGCGSPALLAIREDLGECARCKLAAERTHLVFGVGNPRAELMFIDEGPGADEDQQGEPFVGKAGQLLEDDRAGDGLPARGRLHRERREVPPAGNRNPEPDEIAACRAFLGAQIAAISPKVIVSPSASSRRRRCCATRRPSRLRGSWASYGGVKLMPRSTRRTSSAARRRRSEWEDLQLVMKELGQALPRR